MFYVYKVTNLLNGKFYIGVHGTDHLHDGYMGSGRAVQAAIKKHGKENFDKEFLAGFEIEQHAYDLERLLTKDYNLNSNYNMRPGGHGGWSDEDREKAKRNKKNFSASGIASRNKKVGIHAPGKAVELGRKGGLANKGKKKSPEHIAKIKETKRLRRIAQLDRADIS